MQAASKPENRPPFRAYCVTAAAVNSLLLVAAVVYARRLEIGFELAAPIVAAFLIQASVYLAPCFPELREELARRFSKMRLAAGLTAVSLLPYFVYSIPLGLFSGVTALQLLVFVAVAAFVFVAAPVRRDGFAWQDAVVLAVLVTPNISGMTMFFREAYPSPGEPIPRLDILGKLMVVPLGACAFLLLRRIDQTGLTLRIRREDLSIGLKYFALYLPVGLAVSFAIGHIEWAPRELEGGRLVGEIIGKALGVYLVVSLGEELCFRGVIQNLVSRTVGAVPGNAVASTLFGLVHLSFGSFPNWRHAIASGLMGWFLGLAYVRSGGIVAPMIAHTLVVVVWEFLFRPG